MGVSLWLVPGTTQMSAIKSILPTRTDSDHPPAPTLSTSFVSYPVIVPHITLATVPISNPDIFDVLLDAVPKIQKPLCANFQSLVVGDHYFRSVFIDIQPTQELVDFQTQIFTNLRHHGLEPSAPRFPHMSLCYIADEDERERDRVAQALRETGVVNQTADLQAISLRCGDVCLTGFTGSEIWLVKCEGSVEAWEVYDRKAKLATETS